VSKSDLIGSAAVIAWGLWWVLFPTSVVRFYKWFLGKWSPAVMLPGQVRLAGWVWLALVSVVLWFSFR
jgi:hypothetical protein